jgi:hypothetical protein
LGAGAFGGAFGTAGGGATTDAIAGADSTAGADAAADAIGTVGMTTGTALTANPGIALSGIGGTVVAAVAAMGVRPPDGISVGRVWMNW